MFEFFYQLRNQNRNAESPLRQRKSKEVAL